MSADILNILNIIVLAIVSISTVRQAHLSAKLEQQVHRLNTGLDQSIQLLHRARETAISIQQINVFLLDYVTVDNKSDETHIAKLAELSACKSELRGLAFAIGDEKLLELVNKPNISSGINREEISNLQKKLEIGGKFQQIHTRIAELLGEVTKEIN